MFEIRVPNFLIEFRFWLIKKLVGDSSVAINVACRGPLIGKRKFGVFHGLNFISDNSYNRAALILVEDSVDLGNALEEEISRTDAFIPEVAEKVIHIDKVEL